ncbi:hypothetical protein [Streptomyces sp. NPDC048248]|uniref:hypothetical protein n=1 Tax=Streptomyces sp. NPDC048248 TaxID=3365523 RepID=UPI0037224DFF
MTAAREGYSFAEFITSRSRLSYAALDLGLGVAAVDLHVAQWLHELGDYLDSFPSLHALKSPIRQTHSTPPQRRMRVAPVGCSRFALAQGAPLALRSSG